jgi:hypothetical protein
MQGVSADIMNSVDVAIILKMMMMIMMIVMTTAMITMKMMLMKGGSLLMTHCCFFAVCRTSCFPAFKLNGRPWTRPATCHRHPVGGTFRCRR